MLQYPAQLSEKWLKDSNLHCYVLEGYYPYHSCRFHREHGGVSLFINSDLQAIPNQQYNFVNDIEICTIILKLSTNIFSVIYRQQNKHIGVDECTYI